MAGMLAFKGKRALILLSLGLAIGSAGAHGYSGLGVTAQPWDMGPGKFLFTEDLGHSSQINSLAFTPDGKILVSAEKDGPIFLWDMSRRLRTAILEKAIKGNTSLEVRRRLEQILRNLSDAPIPETVRTIRAITALERIGSPEAQGVLESLARGAPGARETEEARASLERLSQRTIKVP